MPFAIMQQLLHLSRKYPNKTKHWYKTVSSKTYCLENSEHFFSIFLCAKYSKTQFGKVQIFLFCSLFCSSLNLNRWKSRTKLLPIVSFPVNLFARRGRQKIFIYYCSGDEIDIFTTNYAKKLRLIFIGFLNGNSQTREWLASKMTSHCLF